MARQTALPSIDSIIAFTADGAGAAAQMQLGVRRQPPRPSTILASIRPEFPDIRRGMW